MSLCAICLVSGCAVLPGTSHSDSDAAGPTPLPAGMLGRGINTRWRVEVWGNESAPVLRVWDKLHTGAKAILENRTFLPSDLLKSSGNWRLYGLSTDNDLLKIELRYQPNPGAYQHKSFEFDMGAPTHPLVRYRVTTGRGESVDWQAVDFLKRTSSFCRNAPKLNPDDCKPIQAIVLDDPLASLDSMGSAEDYVPPIKMDRRY